MENRRGVGQQGLLTLDLGLMLKLAPALIADRARISAYLHRVIAILQTTDEGRALYADIEGYLSQYRPAPPQR